MAFGLKARTFALLLYLSSNAIASSTRRPQVLSPDSALQALQRRQSTCPGDRPVSCAAIDPKLPSGFCCPANTACISLDASSSALCCPNNGPCEAIEIISCNVGLQNPATPNAGPVVTTRLNDRLPTCGNACCPFGYTCGRRPDGSNFCQLDRTRAITAPASTRSPTPTSNNLLPTISNPTETTSVDPTTQASGIDSTQPQSSKSGGGFSAGAFFAGFFPGMLVGALAVLAWVILTGRHKKGGARVGSEYGKRPEIKDPYGEPTTTRAAFISRTKTLGKSVFARKDPTGTPGLPFDNAEGGWKTLTPPENSNIPAPGVRIPAGPGASIAQAEPTQNGNMPFYGQVVNDPGYPMSPTRTKSMGQESNPTGEILLSYTPQKPPVAAVAPLRGMNTQRRSRDSGFGTGYEKDDQIGGNARAPYADDESDYGSNDYPPSSPSLYSGGVSRRPTIGEENAKKKPDRPETTFTEMLRQINFPDPSSDRNVPAMPAIPKEYRQ